MLQSIRKLLLTLLAALPLLAVADDYELPDLGGAGLASLSSSREAAIGRQIIMQLRDAGMIEDDPELQQYINDIGSRLTASTNTRGQEFNFYVIRDDAVNAFALPGGHIGVNTGLIRRTRNESELASVMAHEIAHVTQRHIARRLEENQNAGLTTLATLLGAIAIAAAGGPPDAVGGTLMLGQGLAIQEQINFTRAQEYEADRLGLDILASADYDPAGMISFFETMQRRQRLQGFNLPEYFSTHPLGTSRVVEATQRARDIKVPAPWETRLYPLVKARLDVMARDIALEPESVTPGAPAEERYRTA
ncbi:MAG: M48 family metallopeptidase, partial [Gammaproteobacteria bacterium]|nr:M48 family metallopeptidase [Gammaproteobacteria bacterium]